MALHLQFYFIVIGAPYNLSMHDKQLITQLVREKGIPIARDQDGALLRDTLLSIRRAAQKEVRRVRAKLSITDTMCINL